MLCNCLLLHVSICGAILMSFRLTCSELSYILQFQTLQQQLSCSSYSKSICICIQNASICMLRASHGRLWGAYLKGVCWFRCHCFAVTLSGCCLPWLITCTNKGRGRSRWRSTWGRLWTLCTKRQACCRKLVCDDGDHSSCAVLFNLSGPKCFCLDICTLTLLPDSWDI